MVSGMARVRERRPYPPAPIAFAAVSKNKFSSLGPHQGFQRGYGFHLLCDARARGCGRVPPVPAPLTVRVSQVTLRFLHAVNSGFSFQEMDVVVIAGHHAAGAMRIVTVTPDAPSPAGVDGVPTAGRIPTRSSRETLSVKRHRWWPGNGDSVNVDSGIPDATGLASMHAIRGVLTS
jgi:hypothetical protein